MIQLQDTDAGRRGHPPRRERLLRRRRAGGARRRRRARDRRPAAGQHRRRPHRERRADRRVGPAPGARDRAAAPRPGRRPAGARATRRSATPSSTARPAPPACRSCRSERSDDRGHAGHARAGRAAALGPPAGAASSGPRPSPISTTPTRRKRLAAAVRDAGWLELRDDGGDGAPLAGGVEAAIVADALGGAVADVAFAGPVLAGDLARRAGVRDDRRRGRRVRADADRRRGRAPGRSRRRRSTPSTAATTTPTRPTCSCPTAPATASREVRVDGRAGRATAPISRVRCGRSRPAPPVHAIAGQRAAPHRRRPRRVDRARPRAHERRPRRRHARRARRHGRVRGRAPAVRRPGRFVPGRAAPARRGALPDGGLAQRRAARVVGGRQPRARRRASRPGASPRRTAPAPRAPCARPRCRCTAASATRGSASCTCTCGARCSRRSGSATTASSCARCSDERLGGGRWTFVTRRPKRSSAARLRAWLAEQQPRPAGVVDRRRVLGAPGRVAHRALRRRLLRAELAGALRRPRPADRVRRDPRRRARGRGRAAAAEPRLPRAGHHARTAATRSRTASFPA